jgi:DNA-binding transcriptional LysR family regulator
VDASWSDLRFLEALARTGSARAAGRDLGVAPSTIYRRIAALEQSVGFPCLGRGRGITPSGRELAELARTTGDSLQDIARRDPQE